tara:strand:- start:1516 stop:2154 length:639 start_codon:yes stop_codon:yes gene_type:complete
MKQGFMFLSYIEQNLKVLVALIACLVVSACSTTVLKSLDTTAMAAENEMSVFLDIHCDDLSIGYEKLSDAKNKIEQAIIDYGFVIAVFEKEQADFILDFTCRKDSDLNLAIVPNEISGMLMVTSFTLIPTYWPSNLWVDMTVYDLRASNVEVVETLKSSFVSQERVVWAPFILFKFAYDFGLPKYNVEKFYTGLRSSIFNLLSEAEAQAIFK